MRNGIVVSLAALLLIGTLLSVLPMQIHAEVQKGTTIIWDTNQTLTGEYRVPADTTLIIQPGVVVTFNCPDPSSYGLYIENGGVLQALGTSEQPITFYRIDANWQPMVYIDAGAGKTNMSNCVFELGESAEASSLEAYSSVLISNCTFYAKATIASITKYDLVDARIENCSFYNSELYIQVLGETKVKNTNFYDTAFSCQAVYTNNGGILIDGIYFNSTEDWNSIDIDTIQYEDLELYFANSTLVYTGTSDAHTMLTIQNNKNARLVNSKINTTATYAVSVYNTNLICEKSCINCSAAADEWSYIKIINSSLDALELSGIADAVNTSLSSTSFSADGVLTCYWPLTVKVTSTDGTPVAKASVTVYDVSGGVVFTGQTDTAGLCKDIQVKEYTNSSTSKTSYTPHKITAKKTPASGEKIVSISSAQTVVVTIQKTLLSSALTAQEGTLVDRDAEITFTIKNTDDVRLSGNITAEFYRDGEMLPYYVKTLPSLAPGQEETVDANTQLTSEGTHTITVRISSDSAEDDYEPEKTASVTAAALKPASASGFGMSFEIIIIAAAAAAVLAVLKRKGGKRNES